MSLFLTPSYIKFSGSYRIFSYAANVISVFFRTLYKKILQQKGYQKLINYKNIWIILQFIILPKYFHQFISVAQSCLTLMQPHDSQHSRSPWPSPTPRVYPNPCPLSGWCHPTISSSVIPFSSCLQSFPASGSFQMSQLFTWGGQSIGVLASTSVLPKNTRDSLF